MKRRRAPTAPMLATLDDVDRALARLALFDGGLMSGGERDVIVAALATHSGYSMPVQRAVLSAMGYRSGLPEHVGRSWAKTWWQALLTTWPAHPVALIMKARANADERPEEALEGFREVARLIPEYAPGRRELATLAMREGLFDEALEHARALVQFDRTTGGLDVAISVLEAGGHAREAAALKRERDLYPGALSLAPATAMLHAGRTDKAIQLLDDIADIDPGHEAVRRIWDLRETRDLGSTRWRVSQHLERFPLDREAMARLALLHHALDGKSAALAFIEDTIAAKGPDDALLEAYESIAGEHYLGAHTDDGLRAIEAARQGMDRSFQGFPAVYLLDELATRLFVNGSTASVRHFVVLLQSKEALDAFGEIGVGANERLLRLRVIKPDGTILEPEHHANVEDISLTGLALGDAVEYLSVSNPQSHLDGAPWTTFTLRRQSPAFLRRARFTVPRSVAESKRFRLVNEQGGPAPVVKRGERDVEIDFVMSPAPALLSELDGVGDLEVSPVVGFSHNLDLGVWARLRGQAALRALEPDPFVNRAAARIAGEGSKEERLARIHRFVMTHIELGESGDPVDTLALGRGRRLFVFIALCQAAGLDVTPVAYRFDALEPRQRIPYGGAFQFQGARVSTGRGVRYYGGTNLELGSLERLSPVTRGAKYLSLSATSAIRRLREVPDAAVSDERVHIQLALEPDEGDRLRGLMAVTIPAHQAEPVRNSLRQTSDEQLRAVFERALGASLPGATVSEVRIPTLALPGLPLGIAVDFAVPVAAEGSAPVRFEHLFAQGAGASLGLLVPVSRYLSVADRGRPVRILPGGERLDVEITLPEGSTFVDVPERLTKKAGPFSLEQRAEVTDGRLRWERSLTSSLARVSPKEWAELRGSLAALAGQTDAAVSFLWSKPKRAGGAKTAAGPSASVPPS